jgi:allantoinase
MFDLAIRSQKIIAGNDMKAGVVIIENGIITEVKRELVGNDNAKVIDVGDKILMAGVIDPHVHINEPGRTDWEGFDTATKAAIAGGITTLVDMPLNSSPVTTTVKAFEEKLAAAQKKIHTNVGFWGGIVPGNENEIEGLIAKGVLGFKAFLTHSGIDEFSNAAEEDLRMAMPIIAKHGLPLLVHCELTSNSPIKPTYSDHTRTPLNDFSSQLNDNSSYQSYLASRPKEWEDEAIALMIRLCEEFSCRTHIVHLSSSNSIKQLTAAKQRGLPITVETGQHYLYFNAEDIMDGQTQFKCAPPIREKANNDKLWDALRTGLIDFVATDHSPAPPNMKQLESGDFMTAWGGIASLQFALPVLWTAAKQRNFAVKDIAKWLCEKPAELIGKPHKGKIEAGSDADLIVWDANKRFTVTEDIIQHRHKITPYLNNELFGVVEQTYLAGERVYDNGEFVKLNAGKIIKK